MLGIRPNHGAFHDNPVAPDPDGATGLTDDAGAVQDAHARPNRDVAAQRRIGCHLGPRIDRWTLPHARSASSFTRAEVYGRYHKALVDRVFDCTVPVPGLKRA